jgi:metallophosphoesterase superfamily enzyme
MANGDPTRTGRTTARTLFVSDLHLGFRHARVRELNEFLHGVEAERLVLVGDIVDALSLARRAFWTAEHTQVVRTLLARQRAGARLIYIPGNHDASLAMLAQMLRGQFEVPRWRRGVDLRTFRHGLRGTPCRREESRRVPQAEGPRHQSRDR